MKLLQLSEKSLDIIILRKHKEEFHLEFKKHFQILESVSEEEEYFTIGNKKNK